MALAFREAMPEGLYAPSLPDGALHFVAGHPTCFSKIK